MARTTNNRTAQTAAEAVAETPVQNETQTPKTNANNLNLFSGNIGYIKDGLTANGNEYLTVFVRYMNDKQICLMEQKRDAETGELLFEEDGKTPVMTPALDEKGNPKPVPVQLYETAGTIEAKKLNKGDLVSFAGIRLVEGNFELKEGDKLHKVRGYVAGSIEVAAKGHTAAVTAEVAEASEGLKKQFSEIAGKLLGNFLGMSKPESTETK